MVIRNQYGTVKNQGLSHGMNMCVCINGAKMVILYYNRI